MKERTPGEPFLAPIEGPYGPCRSCGYEAEEASYGRVAFARSLSEVVLECPTCGRDAPGPKAYPDEESPK